MGPKEGLHHCAMGLCHVQHSFLIWRRTWKGIYLFSVVGRGWLGRGLCSALWALSYLSCVWAWDSTVCVPGELLGDVQVPPLQPWPVCPCPSCATSWEKVLLSWGHVDTPTLPVGRGGVVRGMIMYPFVRLLSPRTVWEQQFLRLPGAHSQQGGWPEPMWAWGSLQETRPSAVRAERAQGD